MLAANLYVPGFTFEGVLELGDPKAGGFGRLSNEVSRDTLIIVTAAHMLVAAIALIRVPPKTD